MLASAFANADRLSSSIVPFAERTPPTLGIREIYGTVVDTSDRIQRIAASVVGRIIRLGVVSVRRKNGPKIVIVDSRVGSGKTPGPRTYSGNNLTATEHRRFPDFGDLFQESVIRATDLIKENPGISDAEIGGAIRWLCYSLIRSNYRKLDVSRKYGEKKVKENPYFNPEGVRESFMYAARWMTDADVWDTLTDTERTAVMMHTRGSTLDAIAEELGYHDSSGVCKLFVRIGRKLFRPDHIEHPPEPGAWVEPTRTKPVQQGRTTPYQLSQG